ncbi:transcriptional regulator with XRE-family HTH domain [Hydrogenoanaerobacterium saccharovorans]|uniref:Transcriptional regulator, contains XRE-family HTH domain n=1 Tax=Hydrogenoanaerobacterium saccharovorans TaxID=474960 RepID=A0A1H8A3L8_9FIRM|nr:helix-turn-helix transcriptional regulator [Hydrogenoanaerobacterium saccharovorans]RPF48225.1 transcriptional regulator with XRE-family HTH domain [Hydrogenoanaerobacterium saccharovorans]SEM64504.1 Transcriptional regulator, contains XRE-family HTH domain [Hydrogenoanaerobacterium saccharovorans]
MDNLLNQFGSQLKKIRLERKMSQEEFADLLKTSKQVISRYETGLRTPKITTANEYAQILGVSLSYLLGEVLEDSGCPDKNMYDVIASLCEKKGNISISKMCKDTGVSRATITDLKMGLTKSLSVENATKIANYFEVGVDYLIGKTDTKNTPTLTEKDERDIAKKLHETLEQLENSQDGLMFDGEPLDDITKELLTASLKNGLEMSKKIAKQKFTPKKYK